MTDPPRVSLALGVWSLSLAIAAPLFGLVGMFWALIALAPTGSDIQVESAYIPGQTAYRVIGFIVVAMTIAAVVLGIMSIAGARQTTSSRPRRVNGIVLGVWALGISAPIACYTLSRLITHT
ncbi:hypothetical protein [Microbacterium sp. P5_E9]